jgi:2-(1,2-epoxy-1,2-dihydrophenyl)acetyl-CoA isomerase
MLSAPAVTYEVDDRVAVLRLNRPDEGNTLSVQVLSALHNHIIMIAGNADIRAVVLTGEGANFSLGGDFGEFTQAISLNESLGRSYFFSRIGVLADVITGLYNLSVPLIAAVNGQAAGAGFSLALACDLRIAEERTRFHFAYGALGASTDGGMSWLLPRIIGAGLAIKLLYEQPVIRAQNALELGLISEIVPKSELASRAVAMAKHLASNSAHANRMAKRLLRSGEFTSLQDHILTEHEAFADGLMSVDMRRALAAREHGEAPAFE